MKVSIVIISYNYAAFIERAIESALDQTHPDTEVLVVDDGSSDHSRELISAFGDRITAIFKPNGGQGSAYNAGFARCSGEAVFFLDSDDWLYPQAAATVAAAFAPGVSKVQFMLDMVDAEGRPKGRRLPNTMDDHDALARLSGFGAYGAPPGSGNAFATEFLRQVLPMEEPPWRTCADSIPILLAPAHGRVVSVHESLGAYRLHNKANTDALTFNNEPKGLWSEYDRMLRCKDMVVAHFRQIGLPYSQPMLLPPWEARLLALCLRFGGPGQPRVPVPRWAGMKLALRSIWRWPGIGLPMRAAQSAWMLCVWLLPGGLARRVGRVDRALKGAAGGA